MESIGMFRDCLDIDLLVVWKVLQSMWWNKLMDDRSFGMTDGYCDEISLLLMSFKFIDRASAFEWSEKGVSPLYCTKQWLERAKLFWGKCFLGIQISIISRNLFCQVDHSWVTLDALENIEFQSLSLSRLLPVRTWIVHIEEFKNLIFSAE